MCLEKCKFNQALNQKANFISHYISVHRLSQTKVQYNIVTNTVVKKLSRNATDGHVCADDEDAEAQRDT